MNYEESWNALRLMFGSRFVPKNTADTTESKDIGNISLSSIMELFENGSISEYRAICNSDKPSLFIDEINDILEDKMFCTQESALEHTRKTWNQQYPEFKFENIDGISVAKKEKIKE